MKINYQYLLDAIAYYTARGYQYVETPWLVSEQADSLTRPSESRALKTVLGNLPASGEQSFLQSYIDGKLLDKKKYVTLTPCFRDEFRYDELHLKHFIKVELIEFGVEDYHQILRDAVSFFSKYTTATIIDMRFGKDIVDYQTGIELGSYGHRHVNGLKWSYGTGCAEPRLSQVIRKNLE